jgi:hypothetical protein
MRILFPAIWLCRPQRGWITCAGRCVESRLLSQLRPALSRLPDAGIETTDLIYDRRVVALHFGDACCTYSGEIWLAFCGVKLCPLSKLLARNIRQSGRAYRSDKLEQHSTHWSGLDCRNRLDTISGKFGVCSDRNVCAKASAISCGAAASAMSRWSLCGSAGRRPFRQPPPSIY